jgi:hypothetical protein
VNDLNWNVALWPLANSNSTSPLGSNTRRITLLLMPNLATRFWADVRFVFSHSGNPLRASPRAASHACIPRRLSASSDPSNSVTRHSWPSSRRFLATHTATAYTSHHRTWEDEALQDVISSWPQQQNLRVSSPDENKSITVRDESLKAASPLQSPVSDCSPPRFDWRLRAPSRAHGTRNDHKTSRDRKGAQSYVKRVIPKQPKIQPGERFHDEVRAYEDRCVFMSYPRLLRSPSLLGFCPCWTSSKRKRKESCGKDWQSGPSSDCAPRVTASPGCQLSG